MPRGVDDDREQPAHPGSRGRGRRRDASVRSGRQERPAGLRRLRHRRARAEGHLRGGRLPAVARRAAHAGAARPLPGGAGRGAHDPGRPGSRLRPDAAATRTRCACCRRRSRCSACTTPTRPTTPGRPTCARRCGSPASSPPRSARTTGCGAARPRCRRTPDSRSRPTSSTCSPAPGPTAVTTKAFDASLTLYAEHELNASTFTTRVIAATLSDMHSAVAGGVGALKGTLHGGAGEAVMRTLLEVGRLDNVDAFVDRAMAREAAPDGLRPSRLHRGRSARRDPEGHGRGGLPAIGPGALVRPRGEAPRQGAGDQAADPERGLLLGAALLLDRHPGRSLHAGHRDRRASRAGRPTCSSSTTTTA